MSCAWDQTSFVTLSDLCLGQRRELRRDITADRRTAVTKHGDLWVESGHLGDGCACCIEIARILRVRTRQQTFVIVEHIARSGAAMSGTAASLIGTMSTGAAVVAAELFDELPYAQKGRSTQIHTHVAGRVFPQR